MRGVFNFYGRFFYVILSRRTGDSLRCRKKTDQFIDITGEVCPMTSIKTKLKLKKMEPGGVLEVRVSEGEPVENLPRTVEREGHKILEIKKEDRFYIVRIERG